MADADDLLLPLSRSLPCVTASATPAEGKDAHWCRDELPPLPPDARLVFEQGPCARAHYSARLLTMRDGTRVAVDVMLPEVRTALQQCSWLSSEQPQGKSGPLDCVFVQARYGRGWRIRWPYKRLWGGKPVDLVYFNFKPLWLASGLAVVSMDVRGTGASFGAWRQPWSAEELGDSLEVLAWLTAQPWSSGRAVLFGQSYDAGCALATAAAAPPSSIAAVVAINPFLDMFDNVSLPGGVPQKQFTHHWAALVKAFDSQRLGDAPDAAGLLGLLARGFARALPADELPTPGSPPLGRAERRALRSRRAEMLTQALAARKGQNWETAKDAAVISFMDDLSPQAGVSAEQMNCARLLPALAATGVPILWTSAWFDATVSSAAAGFAATRHTPGTALLVGPWTHMLWQQVTTSGRGSSSFSSFPFPHEMLRFMKQHLGPAGEHGGGAGGSPAAVQGPRVRLYEMGTSRWLHMPDWPTTESLSLWLGDKRSLSSMAPSTSGRDALRVSLAHRPHGWSRWQAMLNIGKMVRYKRFEDLPLRYTGDQLRAPLRLCGSAVVTLRMDSSDGKGDVFAYLLDVDADGELHYVTEGCLRWVHRTEAASLDALGPRKHALLPQTAPPLPLRSFRKGDAAPELPRFPQPPERMAFPLLPACYVFAPGHRLALALAGADDKHFRAEAGTEGRLMGVSWGSGETCALQLPLLPSNSA